MRKLLNICWVTVLVILLALGFETVIWHIILPITTTIEQLPWLEFVVRVNALLCSALFLALLKPLRSKS